MATFKKFGIAGVGPDVQWGKGGGRIIWATDHFRFRDSTDSAYAPIRANASPVDGNDLATKSYVDGLVQGISAKDSVRVATTVPGTLATSFENGDTIDGVVLATGNRILIKNQAAPAENGIYVVNASGAPTRATDADSAAKLGSAYTFVERGTTHGDQGWVTTFNSSDTLGSSAVNWVQFNGAGSYTASNGVVLTGSDFQLDLGNLGTNTIVSADSIPFYDASISNESRTTVANFITNLNLLTTTDIPTTEQTELAAIDALATTGILVRTGDAGFDTRSIAAAGAGNRAGIAITANADGTAGNPTIGLNIVGLTARSDTVDASDLVPVYNISSGANEYYTVSEIASASSITSLIRDADLDTSVSVEIGDDDTIRFDVGDTPVGYGAVNDIFVMSSAAWTVAMGTADVAATVGAPISITAGTGNTTGAGGDVTIMSGAGGSSAGTGGDITIEAGTGGTSGGTGGIARLRGGTSISGNGGQASVAGGAGVGTNRSGGNATLVGGASTGSGTSGSATVQGGASTGGTTGGTALVRGGTGGSTGVGGAVTLQGGAGGATSGTGGASNVLGGTPTDGNGGAVNVTGASGVGTNRSGGAVVITSGSATGTGTAGSITITAGALGGAGTAGTISINGSAGNGSTTGGPINIVAGSGGSTGSGATTTIDGGSGGSTSGNGGLALLRGGSATDGNGGDASVTGRSATGTNRSGGSVSVTGGAATGTGAGGQVTISGGNLAGAGSGGTVNISGGNGNGATTGGQVLITGGNGGTTGAGAAVTLTAGAGGSTSGNGGSITVQGGLPTSGTGGSVNITARAGAGTNQAGGTVTITAGAATGSGAPGVITLTGTASAVRLPLGVVADEAALTTNGMIRYDSTANKFRGRENGAWVDLIASSSVNFSTITPSGNGNVTSVVADSANDTLTLNASTGIQIDGTAGTDTLTFTFVRTGMADTATVSTDTVPFFDASASNVAQYRSFANIITDLGLVTTTDIPGTEQSELAALDALGNGMVAKTADATYANRTLTAATTGLEGISITNGDGISGNPTIGLNITGLTVSTTLSDTDVLPIYNGTNNRKISWAAIKSELGAEIPNIRTMAAVVNYNSASPVVIGTLPDLSRVLRVRVDVNTAWNAVETIDIGINAGAPDAIMPDTENDPQSLGIYSSEVDYRNASGGSQTVEATVTSGNTPTTGSALVVVEYYTSSSV